MHSFINVAPRYLDPRPALPPPPQYEREKLPINPQFAQVQSRYLSPRRGVAEGGGAPGSSSSDNNSKKKGHQPISKESLFVNEKMKQVHARYLDPALYTPSPSSPRRMVERRLSVDKRELQWRNDFVLGHCKFFDDHVKFTAEREKRTSSPAKVTPFKDTPSVVQAWVKDGVPIRHCSMTTHIQAREASEESPSRAKLTSSPAAQLHPASQQQHHHHHSSGSGNNSRGSSPHRHWSNAGSRNNTTFTERERDTVTARTSYATELKQVQKLVDEHLKAKVSRDHVPRVASLAPGFRLQQMLRSAESDVKPAVINDGVDDIS